MESSFVILPSSEMKIPIACQGNSMSLIKFVGLKHSIANT